MSPFARIRLGVRAFYEAVRYRVGRPRIYATYQSAREDYTKATRVRLQELARYWERNSALVNRLADLFECYVVGPAGLRVNPSSSLVEWNDRAASWWRTWERFADIATRQGFGTLQGMLARSWFVDGECFVYLTFGESNRPRLQVIEAHRIQTPETLADKEGVTIVDGVEIDPKTGRPTGYWVWTATGTTAKEWTKISADVMVHVFEPARAGQYRGIPFLAAALNTLDDLDELKRLELKAARAAAVVANIITNAAGEVDPLSLLASGGVVAENSGVVSANVERLGGETIALKQGETLTQFQSNRPSVVTREYWRDLQAEVCAACGIPAVLVFPDTMQGTQYRGSLDMAATFFASRSNVMQEVVRRIYEWVMKQSVGGEPQLAGAPKDFWNVSIQAPRAVNVDVGRNSAAMVQELANGATNFETIYGEQGLDWREEAKKLAQQVAYYRDLGIPLPFLIQPQGTQNASLQPSN